MSRTPVGNLGYQDETLEVFLHLRPDRSGNLVCHFVDATGTRVMLRVNPQAAQDLREELGNLAALE